MLIFNCSKAFAEFIEPKAGVPALVVPAPTPEQEAEFLQDPNSGEPKQVLQWTAHMVRVRRKPCVVVMETQTRYAMVFTGLKKGDPQSFIQDMIVRLANEMTFAAKTFDVMMAEFEPMISQFMARHCKFAFFLRSDRSVMGHLKEVVWNLEDYAAETQSLPDGHEECAIIDEHSNNTLRSTKAHKGYFVPAEEMLIGWLKDYAGLTAQGETRLRENIRKQNQKAFHEHLATSENRSG